MTNPAGRGPGACSGDALGRRGVAAIVGLLLVISGLLGCGPAEPSTAPTPAPTAAGASATAGSHVPSSSPSTSPAPTSPVPGPAGTRGPRTPGPAVLTVGSPAWVAVSVATLWRAPDSPRPEDAPALAAPVHVTRWLDDMTVEERRQLNGLADSQALLGDRVRLLELLPGWAKVVVPSQPTPLDARGYPGWVPRRQLTGTPPIAAPTIATVTRRTAWLRNDAAEGGRVLRVSIGTRLPVVGTTQRFLRVATPTGEPLRIPKTAVVRHDTDEPALAPTPIGLARTARSFVGLDYLWAGGSGFGVDCSGLTWLSYRLHGVTIPRDASAQWQSGAPVSALEPGDLTFYATAGRVHHVAMYVGDGRMVHSPGTGESVQTVATATPEYAREYVGSRRPLL